MTICDAVKYSKRKKIKLRRFPCTYAGFAFDGENKKFFWRLRFTDEKYSRKYHERVGANRKYFILKVDAISGSILEFKKYKDLVIKD